MTIDTQGLEEKIKKVMDTIDFAEETGRPLTDGKDGIFEDIDDAIAAAAKAQKEYMKLPMATRTKIIDAIRKELGKKENIETICSKVVEETGMGDYDCKLIKQKLVVDKTPGVEDLVTEAFTGDDGLTLVELSPFGVIGAITPTTNPNETIICNSIGMLAAGNTVVFSPHPRSIESSLITVRLINKAIAAAGGPEHLVNTTSKPSLEASQKLMKNPAIRMLVATGGPGVVHAVLSSGKKAIGAGAGNPPVLVDETANIEKAAKDIIDGCSFDNNLPCIAEKEVVAVDQIADYLIFNMKKNGAFQITDRKAIDKIAEMVYPGSLNRDFVGKPATYIAEKAGIEVPKDTRVLIMETSKDHTLAVEELMMPILPIVRVSDVDEGIDVSVELEHGNRHTAMMHSRNVEKLNEMAKRIQTTIFVKNGPSYAGIGVGGEGYTTFTIAGPTGEGLTSAKAFARKRRCVLVGAFNVR